MKFHWNVTASPHTATFDHLPPFSVTTVFFSGSICIFSRTPFSFSSSSKTCRVSVCC